ncbi:BI1-like protein [Manihot esculenta]|uniref:BI1-like protein n=1 Tax=Manihot esculenta TaxID=3983 RepID=A0A2C9W8U9_MANES|nr:BI1-like protein [Manihot esculenta]OAY55881.1 hypothetical protein MANES_03G187200v8 [Manihot esculenta]
MNALRRSSVKFTTTTLHHLRSSSLPHSTSTIRSISSFTQLRFNSTPTYSSQPMPFFDTSVSLLPDHRLPHNFPVVRFLSQKAAQGRSINLDLPQPSEAQGVQHLKEEEKETELVDVKACLENQLRWGFIQKVYGIVTTQVFATSAISSLLVFNPPAVNFLAQIPYIVPGLFVAGLGSLYTMQRYERKYPQNLISLGVFTLIQGVTIGFCCSATDGRIVLEALGLTAAAFSSLTGYTFWAARRGKDFSFLGPILFPSLVTLAAASVLQIFFPLPSGPASLILSGAGAMLFLGYIVYDTDRLIKYFDYDQHLTASLHLYLDVINLFLYIMRILKELTPVPNED